MAYQPQFVSTPVLASVTITASNTGRDGTGTLFNVLTGSTTGTRVDRIVFMYAGTGTSVATIGRVFVNSKLRSEITLAATTASNTAVGASGEITYTNGLIIPNTQVLSTSLSVVNGTGDYFNAIAEGGNF